MATKAERKAAAKAKQTTAPAAPEQATTVQQAAPVVVPAALNPLLAQQLCCGKAYNVRPNTAADNAATWALMQAALQAAPNGTLTRAELQAVAQQRNHVNFVGYAMRRGWLVPATSTPTA